MFLISQLYSQKKNENSKNQDVNKSNGFALKKMMDFELKYKVLTTGERKYLSDFVYGFKKLNAFHESNIKRHLDKMVEKGFELD